MSNPDIVMAEVFIGANGLSQSASRDYLAEMNELHNDEERRDWYDSLTDAEQAELKAMYDEAVKIINDFWGRLMSVMAIRYWY